MDITYNELRSKEVINVTDGRRLGRICDLVISGTDCTVAGIVVPYERKFFRCREDLYIPFRNIKRIGDDCILVMIEQRQFQCKTDSKKKSYCNYIPDDDI